MATKKSKSKKKISKDEHAARRGIASLMKHDDPVIRDLGRALGYLLDTAKGGG